MRVSESEKDGNGGSPSLHTIYVAEGGPTRSFRGNKDGSLPRF